MTEYSSEQNRFTQNQEGLKIPLGLFVVLIVVVLGLAGIGTRYFVYGTVNTIHSLLSFFFSVNLLICYWEVCLFLHRDYVEERVAFWADRCDQKGQSPALTFLCSTVLPRQLFMTKTWADVWASYAQYDGSYADRKTFGYSADVANGFVTPIPTLILYAALTIDFMPVLITGILGVMMFWQWTYVTSVYWVSFFSAERQGHISRREIYIYIIAINAYWVVFALLGLYVSVHLILSGDYTILGL